MGDSRWSSSSVRFSSGIARGEDEFFKWPPRLEEHSGTARRLNASARRHGCSLVFFTHLRFSSLGTFFRRNFDSFLFGFRGFA